MDQKEQISEKNEHVAWEFAGMERRERRSTRCGRTSEKVVEVQEAALVGAGEDKTRTYEGEAIPTSSRSEHTDFLRHSRITRNFRQPSSSVLTGWR